MCINAANSLKPAANARQPGAPLAGAQQAFGNGLMGQLMQNISIKRSAAAPVRQ